MIVTRRPSVSLATDQYGHGPGDEVTDWQRSSERSELLGPYIRLLLYIHNLLYMNATYIPL
jgi:hypothetical protein